MKVCFFSPTAYSYFDPGGKAWAGGAGDEPADVRPADYLAQDRQDERQGQDDDERVLASFTRKPAFDF